MSDHGFIPLGKFSRARDSILHYLCLGFWVNEEFGHVEAPTGYVWRISNDPADVQQENTEVSTILEDWFTDSPEVTDSPELRSELVGHFLVREDSQGFVHVLQFDTEKDLLEVFQTLETEFYEWDEQGEE